MTYVPVPWKVNTLGFRADETRHCPVEPITAPAVRQVGLGDQSLDEAISQLDKQALAAHLVDHCGVAHGIFLCASFCFMPEVLDLLEFLRLEFSVRGVSLGIREMTCEFFKLA